MGLRKFFWLALLGGALVAAVRARAGAGFPERKVFQFGEFMIEASAGDDPAVEALAMKLADFKPETLPPPVPPKLSLEELQQRRDHFLGHMAEHLGWPRPTEEMAARFDEGIKQARARGRVAPPALIRRYALWHSSEVAARLRAGENIPDFALGASGQVEISFQFRPDPPAVRPREGDVAGAENYWVSFVCPIKLDDQPGLTVADEVAVGLDEVTRVLPAVFRAQMLAGEQQDVFRVVREATEAGVAAYFVAGDDRGWFCAGVGSFVAGRVIQDELGSAFARDYYDLPALLAKYQRRSGAELADRPGAPGRAGAKEGDAFDGVGQAYAAKVITDVCARHGDDFLRKWLAEIGRTKRESATMETVFKAYHRLTKEDLHAFLPKPLMGK